MWAGTGHQIYCHSLVEEDWWYCIKCENKCHTLTPSKDFKFVGPTAHAYHVPFSSKTVLFVFAGQNLCSCFWCMLHTAWCYTITKELKSGYKNFQYHVVSLCQRKNQHWFHIDTLRKTVLADQVIPVHLQFQLITNSISTQSQVSTDRFCSD